MFLRHFLILYTSLVLSVLHLAYEMGKWAKDFDFIQAPGGFILFTEQTFYIGPTRSPIQWNQYFFVGIRFPGGTAENSSHLALKLQFAQLLTLILYKFMVRCFILYRGSNIPLHLGPRNENFLMIFL